MHLNYLYKPHNMLSAVLDSIFTNGSRNGNHCSHNGNLNLTIDMGLHYAKFFLVRNNVLPSAPTRNDHVFNFAYINRWSHSFGMVVRLFRANPSLC